MAAVEERQEVRAEAKWLRISPRKARLVTEHIRGRTVPEARTVLAFTDRAAAREIDKVLRSAVANAEANHGLVGDELLVSAAFVDEGPMIKRWRARARGRVGRIRKRTCHVTIKLTPAPEPVQTRRAAERAPAEEEKPKRTPRKAAGAAKAAAETEEKPKRAKRASSPKKPSASAAKPKKES
jgi:large subunit ribosomal protein L22